MAVQESHKKAPPDLFPVADVPGNVGSVVASERRRRRWTQDRLARRAGVNRSTICRMEAGYRPSTADSLFRVALALALDMKLLVPAWPEWEPVQGTGHGPRTRRRRRELGITLAELAAAAGVSEATLSRHERGCSYSSALVRRVGDDDYAACNDALAIALGFASAAEFEDYCWRVDP